MNISSSLVGAPPKRPSLPTRVSLADQRPEATDSDSVILASDSQRNEKVLGTLGAGLGAITGRLGLLAGASAAGAIAGGSLLGPVGAVVGGVVGLGAGAFVEFRDKTFQGVKLFGRAMPLGRIVGGVVGGVIGSTVGKVLDKIPFKQPKLGSTEFQEDSQGFSMKKLLKNVGDVNHTSLPTMNEASKTKEIVVRARPAKD